jgi:flagellin FlaB
VGLLLQHDVDGHELGPPPVFARENLPPFLIWDHDKRQCVHTDRSAVTPPVPSSQRTAQVAIGTLILFIALTLVVLMTATVLFDTAGILSGEAAQTGEDTSSQLSDQVEIIAITGENISNGEIKQVDVVVTISPSGDAVDLRNVTAQWTGPRVGTTLVHEDNANPGQETFSTVAYTDVDGTFPVLTNTDDRYGLRFEPGVAFGETGLQEGERIDLTLVMPAGGTKAVRIAAPQSLAGESSVEL